METKKKILGNIDLLLIGKTGHGKSATGNAILNRNQFNCSASSMSVTSQVTYDVCMYKNRVIKVVDTPGVADTSSIADKQEAEKLVMEQMKEAVILNPDGYHAFLLVFKYGTRFTREEHDSVELLKQILGENILKDYCIIIITCGDFFRRNEGNKTFQQWLREQKQYFGELIRNCNERAVLFDNKTTDKGIKLSQIKQLIKKVKALRKDGKRYSNIHFQHAEECRRELLSKHQEIGLRDDLQDFSVQLRDMLSVFLSEEEDWVDNFDSFITFLKKLYQKDENLSSSRQSNPKISIYLSSVEKSMEKCFSEKKNIMRELHENEIRFERELKRMTTAINKYFEIKQALTDERKDIIERKLKINSQQENLQLEYQSKLKSFMSEMPDSSENEITSTQTVEKDLLSSCEEEYKLKKKILKGDMAALENVIAVNIFEKENEKEVIMNKTGKQTNITNILSERKQIVQKKNRFSQKVTKELNKHHVAYDKLKKEMDTLMNLSSEGCNIL